MPVVFVIIGVAVVAGLALSRATTTDSITRNEEFLAANRQTQLKVLAATPWNLLSNVGLNAKEKAALSATQTFLNRYAMPGKEHILPPDFDDFLKQSETIWTASGHYWRPYFIGENPQEIPKYSSKTVGIGPANIGARSEGFYPVANYQRLKLLSSRGQLRWAWLVYSDVNGDPNPRDAHVEESNQIFVAQLESRVAASFGGGA